MDHSPTPVKEKSFYSFCGVFSRHNLSAGKQLWDLDSTLGNIFRPSLKGGRKKAISGVRALTRAVRAPAEMDISSQDVSCAVWPSYGSCQVTA